MDDQNNLFDDKFWENLNLILKIKQRGILSEFVTETFSGFIMEANIRNILREEKLITCGHFLDKWTSIFTISVVDHIPPRYLDTAHSRYLLARKRSRVHSFIVELQSASSRDIAGTNTLILVTYLVAHRNLSNGCVTF